MSNIEGCDWTGRNYGPATGPWPKHNKSVIQCHNLISREPKKKNNTNFSPPLSLFECSQVVPTVVTHSQSIKRQPFIQPLREDHFLQKSPVMWHNLNTAPLGVIRELYTLISNCPSFFFPERLFVPQGGSHYTTAGHRDYSRAITAKKTQGNHLEGSALVWIGNNE